MVLQILGLAALLFISLLTFLIGCLARDLLRLQKAATAVYIAGYWKAEGVSAHEAAELFGKLRDATSLRPGTATSLGVGDPKA